MSNGPGERGHRRPWVVVIGGLASGWLSGLIPGSPVRRARAQGPLVEAAGHLWEMGDLYWDFANRRIARGVSPAQAVAMADKTAGALWDHRRALAELLPQLDPDTRFATDLSRFVTRWADRSAFRDDLQRLNDGETLGLAISGLKGQVSDPRRTWRTPFPFLRP